VLRAGSLLSLFRTLRAEKPDILHTCLYSAHQIGRVLGKWAGIRRIITSQRAIDLWQKPWQDRLDRLTLPLAHTVIVNSRAAGHVTERRRAQRSARRSSSSPMA